MIDLVALDMAGTTIDDRGAVYVALRNSVEETGATVETADLQHWMGTDKVEAITALMRLGHVPPEEKAVRAAFGRFRSLLRCPRSSVRSSSFILGSGRRTRGPGPGHEQGPGNEEPDRPGLRSAKRMIVVSHDSPNRRAD